MSSLEPISGLQDIFIIRTPRSPGDSLRRRLRRESCRTANPSVAVIEPQSAIIFKKKFYEFHITILIRDGMMAPHCPPGTMKGLGKEGAESWGGFVSSKEPERI